jgi:phosphopantothenoylcysteine decarboxylase/phosphopantothenate--cysteine ligase
MATVIVGVTGSIAAYKSCELVRVLVKAGHDVKVIMTVAATKFAAPLTFQTLSRNPVFVDQFELPSEWKPEHISLADDADLLVIAPCTANVMARMTYGLADDLLTATALATRAPIVIAPAMNTGMWDNVATQANVKTLISRGVLFVDADSGELACGDYGKGRMAEPEAIARVVEQIVSQ